MWHEILVYIIGGIGGVGGILSFYTAKPSKTRIEIDNLRAVIEEERNERISLREEYEEYRERTDKKIDEIKTDNKKKQVAILSAYKCDKIESVTDCPVIQNLDEEV
jgi:hypothetical protein